jgi:hypothetical protein
MGLGSNSLFNHKHSVAASRKSAAFSILALKCGALPKRRYGKLADPNHAENCWGLEIAATKATERYRAGCLFTQE